MQSIKTVSSWQILFLGFKYVENVISKLGLQNYKLNKTEGSRYSYMSIGEINKAGADRKSEVRYDWNAVTRTVTFVVNEGLRKVNFCTKDCSDIVPRSSGKIKFMWYEVPPEDIIIKSTVSPNKKADNWKDINMFATNGSFYGQYDYNNKSVLGTIHVYDSEPITSYSIYNYEDSYQGEQGRIDSAMGVMYLLNDSSTPKIKSDRTYKIPFSHNNVEIKLENIKWAIGGLSLFLRDNSISDYDSYEKVFLQHYPNSLQYKKADGGNVRTPLARTVIGYSEKKKKVIFGVLYLDNGAEEKNNNTILKRTAVNYFEARKILKSNEVDCSDALMLDGGGSTQISYKVGDTIKALGIENSPSDPNFRSVPSMITFTAGLEVNWNTRK